jgi:peptidoglycan/LPS O-acetylase OafA/YrhL
LAENYPELSLTPPATGKNGLFYYPQLDGLRTLAFLMVFFSHTMPFPLTAELARFPVLVFAIDFFNRLKDWGWAGVDLFFVLSAFLITSLLLRERRILGKVSFRQFMMRRILRIWPLYYFMILLAFLILPAFGYFAPLGSSAWWDMVQDHALLYALFLVNTGFIFGATAALPEFITVAWSVAMEEQFYLVWGGILSRLTRRSTLYLIVLTAMPATMLIRAALVYQTGRSDMIGFTFAHLDPILIGILLALLINDGRIRLEKLYKAGPYLFILPCLFFAVLAQTAPGYDQNDPSIIYILSLIAVACGMFLLSLLVWPPAARLFSHPWLVRIGQRTYGMYFLHLLAGQLAIRLVAKPLETYFPDWIVAWFTVMILALLMTWLMATLTWHFLEIPFLKLRKRFTRIPSGLDAQHIGK